ncbi:MAG TPA: cysteine hydrolase family protein [Jatrophihabitans sp.]|nr:cysteine hydrolase family protein [Jatrophihabitans sp.]
MRTQALIVVDVQDGFDDPSWGPRNNPECERNVAALVDRWQELGWPVAVIRHDSVEDDSPLRPDRPGNQLKEFLHGRGDVLITKSVHSAFHGEPDLHQWLGRRGVEAIAVCGITTNHCCETTSRVGADLGYQVTFVGDATATFDRQRLSGEMIAADELAQITFANLSEEFADVRDTAAVLATLPAAAVRRPGFSPSGSRTPPRAR